MKERFTRITSLASVIFPSFKQMARRLSRVERICETNADEIFDELLFDREIDVVLETKEKRLDR